MKSLKFLAIIGFSAVVGLAAACSSGTTMTTTTNTSTANTPAKNTAAVTNNEAAHTTTPGEKSGDETPAAIKAAFPDAQSFIKQHKDITPAQIAAIEKETNAKTPDTDHHSYLAFATKDGKRTQIGAATMVKADGKDVVIVYDNKDGSPVIKDVRADGVAADFTKQFAGKNHDDKFAVGADLKANGVDDATAKAIALAVRIDALTMQNLYGAAHSH